MDDVARVLTVLGGVAVAKDLVSAGLGIRAVQRAAAAGRITRICHGWYAMPGVAPTVIGAIRAGGSLGCVSGTTHHGLWKPPGVAELHVSLPHGGHLLCPEEGRRRPPPVVHWGHPLSREDVGGVLPLLACLAQVMRCLPADYAIAVLESAMRKGLLSPQDVEELAGTASRSARLVRLARADADSGTESLFRFRMYCRGVIMRPQVAIAGVGRVDFVIGDRLIVEIDSETHHGLPTHRRRDLERDAIAVGLGYIVLRFDHSQILGDWETVLSTVLAVIARAEHLDTRRRSS